MIRRNLAVFGGTVATVGFTVALVSAPAVLPFEPIRDALFAQTGVWLWDNPFPSLRYLGGLGGGFVAGYLTRDRWYHAPINAAHALLIGLGIYYLLLFVYNVVAVFPSISPSIVLVLLVQPLLFLVLPFALLYLFEGLISSLFGTAVASGLDTWIDVEERRGLYRRDWVGLRTVLATLAFLLAFAFIWWFGFYFQSIY